MKKKKANTSRSLKGAGAPALAWSAASVGVLFFLRAEFQENSWARLGPNPALSLAWSAVLLLPFAMGLGLVAKFRRANSRDRHLSDKPVSVPHAQFPVSVSRVPGSALALGFGALVFLSPLYKPWLLDRIWRVAPGELMPATQGAWLLFLGGMVLALMLVWNRDAALIPFAVLAGLFLAQQTWGALIHHWDASRSDQLWFLAKGAKDLLSGINPFQPGGTAVYPYPPGEVASQIPAVYLGLDLRFVPILCGVLALALLGALSRVPAWGAWAGAAGVYLGNYTFNADDLYVCPEWLLAGLILLCLSEGWVQASGLVMGLALCSREWFWILLPFWAEEILARPQPGSVRRALAWALVPPALILPLAYGFHPESWLAPALSRADYYADPAKAAELGLTRFGLGWPLLTAGKGSWGLPLSCLALAAFWWGSRPGWQSPIFEKGEGSPRGRGRGTGTAFFAARAGAGLALFQMLNYSVHSYHFLLPAYLLISAAVLASRSEGSRGLYLKE